MYNPLILPDVLQMLEENDSQGLTEFCKVLHPAVTAEILEGLDSRQIWKVLSGCDLERQVEIFGFISLPQQVELVDAVDRERLSRLIEEMAPDDRVDLLERLDPARVDALMPLIAQAERADIRKLLSYPEDSAGSIMTTEYASLPEDITIREALDQLRQQSPERETIYYVYILEEGRRLRGLISLRGLILANPDAHLADVMEKDVIAVRVDDDQEFVAQELAKYNFLAIPVVDNQNQLVGIITHDDVLDVVQEEATEDAHRLGAVEPLEDSYLETPLTTIAWKRGVWLVVLLGASFATAEVLSLYRSSEQSGTPTGKFDWMILFIPLVLASGGNAGSQSATLVIRALALEEMTRRQNFQILKRDCLLGGLLGAFLALLAFAAALCLVGTQQSGIVGSTVFLVVAMANVIGGLLPVLFKRLGMDPALMSTPLIAAMVDVLGVIIYYSVAMAVLGPVTG